VGSDSVSIDQPPRLGFDSSNDAFDYADHIVQHANSRIRGNLINIVKAYRQGDYDIGISCLMAGNKKVDLIFRAIPLKAAPDSLAF